MGPVVVSNIIGVAARIETNSVLRSYCTTYTTARFNRQIGMYSSTACPTVATLIQRLSPARVLPCACGCDVEK
jgi:hypothetical protein